MGPRFREDDDRLVIPAKAGIHWDLRVRMGPRFREDDDRLSEWIAAKAGMTYL